MREGRQSVAGCSNVFQCVAVLLAVWLRCDRGLSVCCSVLQCVEVCYCMLHFITVRGNGCRAEA